MAGIVTQAHYAQGHIHIVHFEATADAADGSFPRTVITTPIEGRLKKLVTNPGGTASTSISPSTSTSPSASISPSVSASASSSPSASPSPSSSGSSTSPSSSISPSRSGSSSISPSTSLSPSASTSLSPSSSRSPSASISPSSSISPSASASPTIASPTTNYDVQLVDQTGYDLLEGVGMNRSASASQHAAVLYSSTSVNPVVDDSDTLTLVIDNHFAVSAQVVIDLYYALGG